MVYNFGRVCLSMYVCMSVCLSVCQTITFASLDVGSSYICKFAVSPGNTGQVRIWRSSGPGQGHRSKLVNVAIALHCNLKSDRTGNQWFCALIMIYYATHGSAHVCSSSSGLPYRFICLRKRDTADVLVCDHVAEMLELSSVYQLPHLLRLSLCPCVPACIGFGIFCA